MSQEKPFDSLQQYLRELEMREERQRGRGEDSRLTAAQRRHVKRIEMWRKLRGVGPMIGAAVIGGGSSEQTFILIIAITLGVWGARIVAKVIDYCIGWMWADAYERVETACFTLAGLIIAGISLSVDDPVLEGGRLACAGLFLAAWPYVWLRWMRSDLNQSAFRRMQADNAAANGAPPRIRE